MQYDPLLVTALVGELERELSGSRVLALGLHRAARRAILWLADETTLRLRLHPSEGWMFLAPGVAPETGAPSTHRFRRLQAASFEAPADERYFGFRLSDRQGRPRQRIVVELHTNQWNLLLLSEPEGRIDAALWPRVAGERELRSDVVWTPPAGGGRAWAREEPSAEEWRELFGPVPPERRRGAALRRVAWLSSVNVEAVLGPALDSSEPAELEAARGRYLALRRAEPRPVLLAGADGPQPYPVPLPGRQGTPMPTLLAGMRAAARTAGIEPEAEPPQLSPAGEEEGAALAAALVAARRRTRRRIAALRRERPDPEEIAALRSAADLLLARQAEVPRGAREARLRDFDGSERVVPLDPAGDAVQNAEALYERARRRERAAERVPAEIRAAEERLRSLERARERVAQSGPDASAWRLVGGRPEGERPAGETVLPYRRYRSSGGLEIRVGRSARSNDDLTFHHSAPEDIWLHARQAAGAHVILRWGRRNQNPPRRDLHEAAVAAAVHSEARHSGTVAVDWTRRKHVRKPRKAPPGAVVPDRTSTVFVEPDASRLRPLDGGS